MLTGKEKLQRVWHFFAKHPNLRNDFDEFNAAAMELLESVFQLENEMLGVLADDGKAFAFKAAVCELAAATAKKITAFIEVIETPVALGPELGAQVLRQYEQEHGHGSSST